MLNLDTHIILFAINGTLTTREKIALDSNECGISQIVLWEIDKLHGLGRIEISLMHSGFIDLLRKLIQWPVSLDVCMRLKDLDFRSDPADEIIAATSLAHDVPLLTRDRKILASQVVPLAV
ncbi:MAG TPA: type II toxin-antitoxin system VapC family toxin [Tepidisphaeraceae bacterium]|jgi:PIN domain nuclease of toxin-antitoxin system